MYVCICVCVESLAGTQRLKVKVIAACVAYVMLCILFFSISSQHSRPNHVTYNF